MTVSRRSFLRATTATGAALSGGALFATATNFGSTSGAIDAFGSTQPLGSSNAIAGSSQIVEVITELGLPAGQPGSVANNQGFMSVLLPQEHQLGERTPATVTFSLEDGTTRAVEVTVPDEGRDRQPTSRVSTMIPIPDGAQAVVLDGAETVYLHDYHADGVPDAIVVDPDPADASPADPDPADRDPADRDPADAIPADPELANPNLATLDAADPAPAMAAAAQPGVTPYAGNLNAASNLSSEAARLAANVSVEDVVGSIAAGGIIAGTIAGLINRSGVPTLPSLPGIPASAGANVIDGLQVVSRAQWGADESLMGWTPNFTPAQLITIHHTAMPTTPAEDYAAQVRAIYRFHASSANGGRGWGDVGYHLLIAPNGVVYQGRSTGEAGQAVFSRGSTMGVGRPQVVTAGHVYNVNDGNIGVCMMGDFTNATPTAAAVDALVRVLGHLCRGIGADPRGGVRYVNDLSRISVWRNIISGHRDWGDVSTATSCPGNAFYPQLVSVRSRV